MVRWAWAAGIVLLGPAASASAQGGFDLDRLQPPPSADDGLALARPDTLGAGRFSARLAIDYAHAPLVLARTSGGDVGAVVSHRVVGHLLFAIGAGDRVEIHAGLPLTLVQSGAEEVDNEGFETPSGLALGDPGLGASVRLAGEPGQDGPSFGLAASLLLPLGDEEQLSGDDGVGARVHALGAFQSGKLTPVLDLGFGYRPSRDVIGGEVGSELLFGAGLHVQTSPAVRLAFELHGASAFDFSSTGTALELDAGAQLRFSGVAVDLGLGLGLTSAIGTPDVRVLAGIGYVSPAPGAAEEEVDVERVSTVTDADGDGVPDTTDGCPEPEDRDGNQDGDGCPDPDDDGDGVLDEQDECRAEAETRNGVGDEDGCPERVELTENEIVPPAPILFDEGSAELGEAAREMLRAVAETLQSETSIRFVQVEGHASGEGTRRRSLSLSEGRAAAAMRFLIEQGIDADRLGSVGNGAAQPEVRGNSPEAHLRNRRVELRIVERE